MLIKNEPRQHLLGRRVRVTVGRHFGFVGKVAWHSLVGGKWKTWKVGIIADDGDRAVVLTEQVEPLPSVAPSTTIDQPTSAQDATGCV